MKFRKPLAAVAFAAVLFVAGAASATPVLFSVTAMDYDIGRGYGCRNNTSLRLCVSFSTARFSAQTFPLNEGDSFTFDVGRVRLHDERRLHLRERDRLGVRAALTFATPFSGDVTANARGRAIAGRFNDTAVDLRILFGDSIQAFGNGGEFNLEFSDLRFTQNRQARIQTATVTLLRAPAVDPVPVPEPATLTLLGMGGLGLGLARRRR